MTGIKVNGASCWTGEQAFKSFLAVSLIPIADFARCCLNSFGLADEGCG
jgi:hypothetical protein